MSLLSANLRQALIASAFLSSGIPVAASASPPVVVTRCEPVTSQKAGSSAYTPGYYPKAGAYYWQDPYGRRYYEYPPATVSESTPQWQISYVIKQLAPIVAVEFGLVADGKLVAEARDAGPLPSGVEIHHRFGLDPAIFPVASSSPRCVVMRAIYKAGGVWTSSHLPVSPSKTLYK